jgi:hypothetical protein
MILPVEIYHRMPGCSRSRKEIQMSDITLRTANTETIFDKMERLWKREIRDPTEHVGE